MRQLREKQKKEQIEKEKLQESVEIQLKAKEYEDVNIITVTKI